MGDKTFKERAQAVWETLTTPVRKAYIKWRLEDDRKNLKTYIARVDALESPSNDMIHDRVLELKDDSKYYAYELLRKAPSILKSLDEEDRMPVLECMATISEKDPIAACYFFDYAPKTMKRLSPEAKKAALEHTKKLAEKDADRAVGLYIELPPVMNGLGSAYAERALALTERIAEHEEETAFSFIKLSQRAKKLDDAQKDVLFTSLETLVDDGHYESAMYVMYYAPNALRSLPSRNVPILLASATKIADDHSPVAVLLEDVRKTAKKLRGEDLDLLIELTRSLTEGHRTSSDACSFHPLWDHFERRPHQLDKLGDRKPLVASITRSINAHDPENGYRFLCSAESTLRKTSPHDQGLILTRMARIADKDADAVQEFFKRSPTALGKLDEGSKELVLDNAVRAMEKDAWYGSLSLIATPALLQATDAAQHPVLLHRLSVMDERALVSAYTAQIFPDDAGIKEKAEKLFWKLRPLERRTANDCLEMLPTSLERIPQQYHRRAMDFFDSIKIVEGKYPYRVKDIIKYLPRAFQIREDCIPALLECARTVSEDDLFACEQTLDEAPNVFRKVDQEYILPLLEGTKKIADKKHTGYLMFTKSPEVLGCLSRDQKRRLMHDLDDIIEKDAKGAINMYLSLPDTFKETSRRYHATLFDDCLAIARGSPMEAYGFLEKAPDKIEDLPAHHRSRIVGYMHEMAKTAPRSLYPFLTQADKALEGLDAEEQKVAFACMDLLVELDGEVAAHYFHNSPAFLKSIPKEKHKDVDHVLIEYVHDQRSANVVSRIIKPDRKKEYMARIAKICIYG